MWVPDPVVELIVPWLLGGSLEIGRPGWERGVESFGRFRSWVAYLVPKSARDVGVMHGDDALQNWKGGEWLI